MSEPAKLLEKRKELDAKSKRFEELMTAATTEDGRNDFTRKDFLEKLGAKDATEAKEKVTGLSAEITTLMADVDDLTLVEMKSNNARVRKYLDQPVRDRIPGSSLTDEPKTLGDLVIASKGGQFMQDLRDKRGAGVRTEVDVGLKTLLQTSAGFQPRTGVGDVIVPGIIRPVQVLDFIPTDTTDLFEYPFMQETTRTQAAAELAEGGTYAEDAFAYTRAVAPVRKIGSEIPATDEQLADVGPLRALIDNRLRFGLLARVDQQLVVGDGTGSNLTGAFNATNVATQAKGSDPTANAIFKGIVKVRVTGRSVPDVVMMHGLDWQNLRLAQNANGDYQFGPPSQVGADTLWGLPLLQTEALTQGNALVGAFKTMSLLLYRKGIEVATGYIANQFIQGQITLRADVRVAFAIFRGQAFCKVTGI